MALSIEESTLNAVRIIASADDAVDRSASDWEAYKETRDESKLVLLPGKAPTIFICNFEAGIKEAKLIDNAMMATKGDDDKPSLAYGSWAQMVAKVTLKEIQNPEYMPEAKRLVMRKDGAGYVHDDLLGKLQRAGVVNDIFNAYMTSQQKRDTPAEVKN